MLSMKQTLKKKKLFDVLLLHPLTVQNMQARLQDKFYFRSNFFMRFVSSKTFFKFTENSCCKLDFLALKLNSFISN